MWAKVSPLKVPGSWASHYWGLRHLGASVAAASVIQVIYFPAVPEFQQNPVSHLKVPGSSKVSHYFWGLCHRYPP